MALAMAKGRVVVPHAGTWIEIDEWIPVIMAVIVVPHAGTWIEMQLWDLLFLRSTVVPHAGTWIEIGRVNGLAERYLSFPTRERGLK